jgi:hypothetical protein
MGFSSPPPAVLSYLSSTNLYVNSGSGNDSGAGTIADPLQSLEQALKNVYARRLNSDFTACKILLSGAVGDYDTTSAIVYYWPGKYNDNIPFLTIMGWDGAETNPETEAPSYLYTGSATLWANPADTVVDYAGWNSGSLLRLYTDSDYTTPVYLGTPGTLGPLSQGWQLVANTPGRGRPVAHVVDHIGNTNTIRIGGCDSKNRMDQSGSAYGNGTSWDTLGRGSSGLKIIRYGAKIDYTQLLDAYGKNANLYAQGNQRQDYYFLELTSSHPTYDKGGRWNAGGSWNFFDCHIKTETGAGLGGMQSYYRSYYGPNDGPSFGSNNGKTLLISAIVDAQFTEAYPEDAMELKNEMLFRGQSIFQNFPSLTDGIKIGSNATLIADGEPGFTVFHLTGCAGIGSGEQGAFVRTDGNPIRLIGELNDAGNYGLRLISGSSWNWDTDNDLRQQGGALDCLVSVTNGETSGSADVATNTYIFGYSSSFGVQNDFATDYSASFYSLIGDAS